MRRLTAFFALLILLLGVAAKPTLAAESNSVDAPAILGAYDAYLDETMRKFPVPGMAVAIIKNGATIFNKGYGIRDIRSRKPVTKNTVFQAGSTTKSFTTALVGMAVDEGLFEWDDRVVGIDPSFMLYDAWVTREFTVADLLSQRSGLESNHGDRMYYFGATGDEILRALRHLEPVSSFRLEFAYQNSLFLQAARLAEIRSGQSWPQLMRERIFTPLGMNHSSVTRQEFFQSNNHAALHQNRNGEITRLSENWDYNNGVYAFAPAGSLATSSTDMARWIAFHMGNGTLVDGTKLLDEETLTFLHEPRTYIAHMNWYCKGWVRSEREDYTLIWHNGATSGAKSFIGFNPDTKTGLVILTNLADTKLPDKLAFDFFDWLQTGNNPRAAMEYLAEYEKDIAEKWNPEPPAAVRPPRPLDEYTGTYASPVYGNAVIMAKGGKLYAKLGRIEKLVPLTHYDADTFIMHLEFVDGTPTGYARFTSEPEDGVQSVLLEPFEQNGIGEFIRVEVK